MIKTDKIRILNGDNGQFGPSILIKEIYPAYRFAFVGPKGSQKPHTYKKFPRVEAQVLEGGLNTNGEKLTKEMETTLGAEWREQIWNDKTSKFDFHKCKNDREFYKNFPKQFDMVIEVEKAINVFAYNPETKEKQDNMVNEFTLQVKAGKLKEIISALVEDPIPMDGEYPKNDYEDEFKDKLKGKFFKLKATKSGKKIGDENQYDVYDFVFKEGKEFKILDEVFETPKSKEISLEDIPFN